MSETTIRDKLLCYGVHLLTASGAVLGAFALIAIASHRLDLAAYLMLVSLVVDSFDGTLARAADVSTHTPEINGRRLDDIVDYLNFVIVPIFFMWGAGSILHPAWLAAPVLASAYGFSREDAKTADDFFLGFPSYWNVLALYLWLLDLSPFAGTLWLVGLSIAVFIPMKYLYPSKVQPMGLRIALGVAAVLWTASLIVCVRSPELAARLSLPTLSLLFPAWYMGLSFTRGGFDRSAG